ncbi:MULTISPECIES: RNA 2',3'-cyclic phosphodiesterase [Marinobacter]|uniref:RNA 2',3'-cyclic phosphodiesterase n=1 Tax=Marinobacter TaxID=2742 RepID=UPI0012483A11|nr:MULTISPECIES: RNA 2',3'-cyclic phosphodiesterase [Marinobacter]MBL3558927.1 RNA 2',3'-cyclic phosphodiesterase [Marinobacter sp. JB05H06]
MDKPERLRLFFGLEIPDPVKQRLLTVQQPVTGARWQRADQLHLTLAFLGSVEAHRLPDVRDAARNLPVEPFDLTVTGIGCFGHPDRPKNLWAGVQPVDKLAGLQRALSHRLIFAGFAQERRAFRPHITLARFNRKQAGSVGEALRMHREIQAGTFLVESVALFRSIQKAHGSAYTVLDRFLFR